MIASRRISADESLLNLRDIDSGKTVQAHGGSVYWNAYRNRWVMITVESFGSTSMLGEVWYAEADTPLGPWVYARKVVTHDKYSFYNPKQHPMFDKEGGRIIFFEGTYTTTFSGNPDPTPRYDYNQIMYQLDLADPRLALPVAIYHSTDRPEAAARLAPKALQNESNTDGPRRGWPSSPRIATGSQHCRSMRSTIPRSARRCGSARHVRCQMPAGAEPLFFVLPADIKDYTSATTPLYELMAAKCCRKSLYDRFAQSPGSHWVDVQGARPRLEKPGELGVLVSGCNQGFANHRSRIGALQPLHQNKCRLSLRERTFLRGAKDDNSATLFWCGLLGCQRGKYRPPVVLHADDRPAMLLCRVEGFIEVPDS